MIDLSKIKKTACPICHSSFSSYQDDIFIKISYNKKILVAKCFNPSSHDPLHYYMYAANLVNTDMLLIETMSVNIGNRSVLFSNYYFEQKSYIWSKRNSKPIELPFIIEPDYPHLTRLKKKVSLSIIFG